MSRLFLILGALSAALGVAAGAFGAHALRTRVEPRLLEVFETGARYQMYHALALIAVGLVLARGGGVLTVNAALGTPGAGAVTDATASGAGFAVASGWLFVAGTVFFSGSLYAMTFTGVRALGAITPIGGVCFIAGWVCLAVAAMRFA
jgi:uncharacterized membrane protein YgdD (TMEM256/DUF423 family)